MISVFRKIEKSKEHPTGFVEVKSEDLDRPFLFCISAQPTLERSIYGSVRQGAQAARVYTTQEIAAGYKIDEMPVDFLGVRFEKDLTYSKTAPELVDKFLYPFLVKNGKDVDTLRRRARLMNFMTYCDGTSTYKEIEACLEKKLKADGLSQEEIDSILSQIKLAAVGTMEDTATLKCTSVIFVDVNDPEISTNRGNKIKGMIQERGKQGLHGNFGKTTNGFYYYEGSGEHSLKEYFRDGIRVKPVLGYVISQFLDCSIRDREVVLTDLLPGMRKYSDETKSVEELQSELDATVEYEGVTKYKPGEAVIRGELDEAYTTLAKTQRDLEISKLTARRLSQGQTDIIAGIKKYSSNMTFYQILVEARVWQAPEGIEPYKFLSDKEVREKAEEMGIETKKKTAIPGVSETVSEAIEKQEPEQGSGAPKM